MGWMQYSIRVGELGFFEIGCIVRKRWYCAPFEARNTFWTASSPSFTLGCIGLFYEEVKKVLRSHEYGNVWIENSIGKAELSVGFVQSFSEKATTMLNSTVLVAYPTRAILLNLSAWWRNWLLGDEYTLVRFLLVCYTQKQLKEYGSGADKNISVNGIKSSMKVPWESSAPLTEN